jgi:rRNA-processing protein FCF1
MSETLFSGIPNDVLIVQTVQKLECLTGEPVVLATFDKQLLRFAKSEGVRTIFVLRCDGKIDFELPHVGA